MPRPLLATLAGTLLVAMAAGVWPRPAAAADPIAKVAVFPVENLSGTAIRADQVRDAFIERLSAAGVTVLGADDLDAFMARHRIRYAAGIDAASAEQLRKEAGVDAALFVSVGYWSETSPPKLSLIARLVSVRAAPVVIWADDAGLAGDEAPGLFDLGLVDDFQVLQARALDRLGRSLAARLETGQAAAAGRQGARFRPRITYRAVTLEPGRAHSVAVLPFYNVSGRRNAGDVMALLFERHLSSSGTFRVIDRGDVRQQLLQARVIMEGGVSIEDAELVASVLDADFVLAGRVIYYDDYEGPEGHARVDFSTVLIERASRRVVWSSHSYNDGEDGVRFFGRGRFTLAHAMATRMTGLTVAALAGERR